MAEGLSVSRAGSGGNGKEERDSGHCVEGSQNTVIGGKVKI